MFGSIPGLWAVLPLIPGHPGQARHQACVMNWNSHGMAIPTSSISLLPQDVLQACQIVGGRLCGSVGNRNKRYLTGSGRDGKRVL